MSDPRFACLAALVVTGFGGDPRPDLAREVPSPAAREIAESTLRSYGAQSVETLGQLIAFATFAREGVPAAEDPQVRAMTAYLEGLADEFGLDFQDHGAVVVVGLGGGSERLGIITHGDVQPADASKWAADPFELDTESEPGRLVGRGVEDDKGPIVCALYAMRAIRESGIALHKRIELIISYTEESDWAPFRAFLAQNPPPALNVALDAEYPVVTAEKGWCTVTVQIPVRSAGASTEPELVSFTGGYLLSQVPEDATAVVRRPTDALMRLLREKAGEDSEVSYRFEARGEQLTIHARGRSAHSSKPEQGRNAITHLSALLGHQDWPAGGAGSMVELTNDLVGTGFHAERFGDLAYEHPFMGPLTLSFSTLAVEDGSLVGRINLRRPAGRSRERVEATVKQALEAWRETSKVPELEYSMYVGEPHPPQAAPHIGPLLDTYRHYTGDQEAEPLSIGGGTHARLVPHGVNFGPSMPGETYTGHSEHEYMSRAQFLLNLRMYTSLLVDLATE